MKDTGKDFAGEEKSIVKKPYEKAKIEEHEPLEEATATTYYYYEYAF
jgi:hypothetical protein